MELYIRNKSKSYANGGGIHARWPLARVDGVIWSAVGSLNGGEVSHKINREVVLLVDSPAVYDRLAAVFAWDWERLSGS